MSAPDHRRSWLAWFLAVLPVAALVVVSAVVVGGRLDLPGVQPLPAFADLAQVTYNADCTAPDAGVTGSTSCDAFGRPYNYPPVWAGTVRLLGMGAAQTTEIGLVLSALACLALAAVCLVLLAGRMDVKRTLAVTAAMVSPPMLLMIERGNTDLVIVVLLSGAILTLRSHRLNVVSVLCLGLAAGLKLFPAGGLLALRRRSELALGIGAVAVAVGVLALPYLEAIRAGTPAVPVQSFGAGVVPAIVSAEWQEVALGAVITPHQAAGVLLVAAGMLAVLLHRPTRDRAQSMARALSADDLTRAAFLVGAGSFLASFLLTTSFDYRLFPLIFVVVACARAGHRSGLGGLAVAAVVGLWAAYPLPPSLEFAGDLFLFPLAAVLAALALTMFVWEVGPRTWWADARSASGERAAAEPALAHASRSDSNG